MDWLTVFRLLWDRALAAACAVGGALALTLGWWGVHDKLFVAEQIPYLISGGLGGLFLMGVAAVLWISADLRDEWRKLDEMHATLLGVTAPNTPPER